MNAIQTEVSDGTLKVVQVGLEYIEQADISVYLGTASVPLVPGTDYSWTATNTITLAGAPLAAGVVLTLRRTTASLRMLNVYDGGAAFRVATIALNLG